MNATRQTVDVRCSETKEWRFSHDGKKPSNGTRELSPVSPQRAALYGSVIPGTRERTHRMNEHINSPELQALLELQDTQKETASTIMAQIVELQASLQVMMDLQMLSLVKSGQFEQPELDVYCQTRWTGTGGTVWRFQKTMWRLRRRCWRMTVGR